jgi:dTDP-4-dehydrorhamnose reductase
MFGAEMVKLLRDRGFDVSGFNRDNMDLTVSVASDLVETLSGFDVIVNAVAFTAVDLAEDEIIEANAINAIAAGKLAEAAALVGAKFMHISTDYVFGGDATEPYLVTDPTNPQTEYGRSKALGELLVSESEANYTIFRTAWLYGAAGKNFAKTIATVLRAKGSARVVKDQIGQPTWVRDLAEQVLAYALIDDAPKIVHAVSSGQASWADFAEEIAISLGLEATVVIGVSSQERSMPAKRPAWSVLDNSSDLVAPIGDWRERWAVASDEVLGSR